MSNLSTRDTIQFAFFAVAIFLLIAAIGTQVFNDIVLRSQTIAIEATANPLPPVAPTNTTSVSLPPPVEQPTPAIPPPQPTTPTITKTYVEVTDGCAAHFQGECLLVRSGPGKNFPVVSKLRNGVVLRAEPATTTTDGISWYKILFDEWLRYPERQRGTWYIAANYVTVLEQPVEADFVVDVTPTTTKYIIVNRTTQRLTAYDGDTIFMSATTSTGLDSTPTPRGVFTIYRKTPSRYMQGPLPNLDSKQYYDLPGVPWNLYFTSGGAVIHGAYWHTSFGTQFSHGCVNLTPAEARILYEWAPVGTTVTVKD